MLNSYTARYILYEIPIEKITVITIKAFYGMLIDNKIFQTIAII